MREIKFRGISRYTGEMVYGQLLRGENNFNIVTDFWGVIGELVPIKKGTQGQYTGLKDENGVEIYEGDIIHRVSIDWDVAEVYQVVWGGVDYPAWDVKPWHDSECNFFSEYIANDDEWGTLEIIGNIHENPELLEK